MDSEISIQELKDRLKKFRDERDWAQFHDPKNLAEAISIEAGELQELFLWKEKEAIARKLNSDPAFRERVGEELADIVTFCFNFANSTELDISTVVIDKIDKTNKKYPVEKAKGVATKYTEL